jgi:hypothetical protein
MMELMMVLVMVLVMELMMVLVLVLVMDRRQHQQGDWLPMYNKSKTDEHVRWSVANIKY